MSIIPGIENLAPERTLTSSGSAGSPSFLPIVLLDLADGLGDLVVERRRPAAVEVGAAGVGGDGEPRRHRQLEHRGHLGEVGALAAEQVLHLHRGLAVLVVEAEDEGHEGRAYSARPAQSFTAMRLKLSGICGSSGGMRQSCSATSTMNGHRCMKQVGRSTSDSIRIPALARAVTMAPMPWFHSTVSLCSKVAVGIGVVGPVRRGRRPTPTGPSWKYEYFTVRSVSLRHQWVTGWNSTRCSRPPGRSSSCHDARPRVDVREPAEGSDPGVDAVERSTTESGRRVVHVGHLELGLELGARRQLAGREDRRLAQIDADDAGAEAGPAEGVHAEVALEVDEVEAGDVARLLDLVRHEVACHLPKSGRRRRSRSRRGSRPARPTTCG